MADDEDVTPQAGELTTANYGWVKPTVGDSDDAWGGYLNTDLDGIDSTVKSVSNAIPAASSMTPVMSGAGAVGAGTTWARADHQHPSDTSRYATSNPSGYQTAAQVTAALPVASSTTPVMDGIAAVGVGTTWARADHVHPLASQAIGDNRIINGDMRIDQRNNGASGTAATTLPYTVDRWFFYGSQASKGTWGRNLNAQPGPSASFGFPYCLGFQSSSAYASVAADQFIFCQSIEADAVGDFMWGTAGAQPATLSFFVFSSLIGTFSGCVQNYAGTRSYPFSYSIPAAGWYKIAVTIPGDTAGTWVLSGNAGAVNVVFDLGSGSSKRGPANAWASAGYNGVTGSVSIVATNGAAFYVTGVKLEIGSVATPFNRQSLAKSLADCQRYYQPLNSLIIAGYNTTSSLIYAGVPFPVTMRATPTIAFSAFTPNNASALGVTVNSLNSATIQAQVTGTGNATVTTTITLSAEI